MAFDGGSPPAWVVVKLLDDIEELVVERDRLKMENMAYERAIDQMCGGRKRKAEK
ncbi:MAG: hypothetical protein NUV84_02995 [Candidatus Uhrbacteria bacterium]|nr:hypothetical protein [Candidatus Uhrbacteria bacterium]